MIIQCVNCNKRFEVDSSKIPEKGRTIQCGICNHIWFYDKKIKDTPQILEKENILKQTQIHNEFEKKEININQNIKNDDKKTKELTIFKKSSNFGFGKILSYFFVLIISLVGFIILLDTFKLPLSNIFPEIELLLYNLFESIKDMILFIKDLFI